jgi:hypothetical protein
VRSRTILMASISLPLWSARTASGGSSSMQSPQYGLLFI